MTPEAGTPDTTPAPAAGDALYVMHRHVHGITITGEVPVEEFRLLTEAWAREHKSMIVVGDLAPLLGVDFVVCWDAEHADAWRAMKGVRVDSSDWLLSGDTGLSSLTIWATFTGQWQHLRWGRKSASKPQDADDFGRCYRLLRRYPEWRARLHEVVPHCPGFAPLVAAWDELTSLYEKEGRLDPQGRATRDCPKLYARMRELLRGSVS